MADEKHMFQFEKKDPFYKEPAFLVVIITLAIALTLFLLFYKKDILQSMTTEEVGKSIQIVSQASIWVDKRVLPDEATIVPSITFKVKNVSQKSLRWVSFQGVFVYEDTGEGLSDGYAMALKNPLPPGQISDEIFIKSSFGITATSKEAFFQNLQNWRKVKVKVYARTRNSGYVLLGIYPVAQEIEGIKVQYDTTPVTIPKK